MSKFKHDLLLRLIKLVDAVLMTIPFALCWYLYYSDRTASPFDQKGNLIVVLLFLVLFIIFGRIYDAFMMSIQQISEIVYAQFLAVAVSDLIIYDFTQHTRAEATLHIEPKPIIIIEGILTLQNVELVNLMDIKIFVEADADERILRRAIRDVKERGRDLEGVAEQYLQTVKPMHYLYVEPTKNVADIVINGGMNDVAFDIVSTKIKALLEGYKNDT